MLRHGLLRAVASGALAAAVTVGGAGSAVASSNRPDPPANVRVTDLHAEGMTVAWDPVAGASEYTVTAHTTICCHPSRRATTTELHETFVNLAWDITYQVSVRAKVGYTYTYSSTITVTTPSIAGYEPPKAPANLRVERDAQGRLELFRWDAAAGGHGTITYRFHLESPGFLSPSVWGTTDGLALDAGNLPVCDGCEYDPNQTIIVWVTAKDRRHESPPSQPLTLTCCPF